MVYSAHRADTQLISSRSKSHLPGFPIRTQRRNSYTRRSLLTQNSTERPSYEDDEKCH